MRNGLLTFFTFITLNSFAAAPVVSSLTPVSASSGMTVTIAGTNFTGVLLVSFGGVAAASFTVVSSTQINAVVGLGSSGAVQVTTIAGAGSKNGFIYLPTSGIITDFGGFWSATGANPNAVVPDSSHNLLAFTYDGVTYSTGVNNTILNNNNVIYALGNYKALPVAGVAGTNGSSSTYLALAEKVDGSATVANTPAIASYSVKTALTDGPNGLNLGTGVTNLPATAILTFQIFNINPVAIADDVPDIILTQIAQPVSGNDVFSFIDASGAVVGNSITQDMTLLPKFGTYNLDLFNLTPNTLYNIATAYSSFSTATNREIRLAGFRLSDFGITALNVSQVKALQITPSGNSDYAFIAYNADAINMPPNISLNDAASNLTICSGGTANMAIVATPAGGGALTYSWEESVNGGSSWSSVSNGGNYTGATTAKLSVAGAINGYKYRATVNENGNSINGLSTVFTVAVSTPAAPTAASISGGASACLNTALQLSSSVTGGSNLYYQWQTNASGAYADIAGAVSGTYIPPVNQTGSISYRLNVSSGSGCALGITTAPATVTIGGISTTTPAAVCASGALVLNATATAGTIDWYAADAGGSSLTTGNAYTTPVLAGSKTYYVAASGCSSALRVPVTATVYPNSIGGTIAGAIAVLPNINNSTLTLNANVGAVVKWQSSTDVFNTNIVDVSSTASLLSVVNLTQNTSYRAVVQSGTCAAAFSAIGTITLNAALPISNTVKATKQNKSTLVQWTAYDQQNTLRYEVEKSTDGTSFTKVYTAMTEYSNSATVSYQWTDNNPANGTNYYRVKEILRSGTADYSSVVSVNFDRVKAGISVYPNPVVDNNLHLQLNSVAAGLYYVRVISNQGQSVYQSGFTQTAAVSQQTITLPEINKGVYTIEITGPGGFKNNTRVIVL